MKLLSWMDAVQKTQQADNFKVKWDYDKPDWKPAIKIWIAGETLIIAFAIVWMLVRI